MIPLYRLWLTLTVLIGTMLAYGHIDSSLADTDVLPMDSGSVTTQSFDTENTITEKKTKEAYQKSRQSKIEAFFDSYEQDSFTQYGYDILSGGVIETKLRVGPEYKVGPDDTVQISIWGGALNALGNTSKAGGNSNYVEYRLTVNNNGSLIIPEIGVVAVNGRTLEELSNIVSSKFKNYCRDCQVSVSIEKPRSIRVFVTGHVLNPGYVQVLSGSSVYDTLLAAGGITKQGSLRNITLKKGGGKQKETVDLYPFINSGDLNTMPDVRLGDIVHVNAIGPVVLVKGQVQHPAIYELKDDESLSTLITFSGGILPDSETRHIEITRFEKGKRILINTNMEDGELKLANGDTIRFPKQYAMLSGSVKLLGYVPIPKSYAWHDRLFLKDILSDIGMFKPETAMDYAEIRRYDQETMEPSIVPFSPDRVLNWEKNDAKEANILMQPLDEVVLFSIAQMSEKPMVSISGGVNKPGKYKWVEDMTVMNVIRSAGGMNWMACDKGIVVRYTYDDQHKWTTSVLDFDLAAIRSDVAKDIKLKPLDRVIINRRSDFSQTEWQVTVEGEVNYPGAYPIGAQTRLSDVLVYSGSLTEAADLEGLQIYREDAKKLQDTHQKTSEEVLRKGLLGVASQVKNTYMTQEERMDNKQSLAIIENYLASAESRKAEGRVILSEKDLSSLKALKDSDSDILMQPGDRIVVPEKTGMITIAGEVYNPSSYLYKEKDRVSDYLELAGGIAPFADIQAAFILRKNGTVLSYAQKEGKFTDIIMKSGDVLIVPSKILHMIKQ